MSERIWKSVVAWKVVCLVLASVLIVQVGHAVNEIRNPSIGGMAAAVVSPPGSEADVGPDRAMDPPDPGKTAEVPAAYQPIIDKRLFGVVPPRRTLPIVLEGIAHDVVFLGTPAGRSGLVRVGETLDGVKLLEIAQNRVLVEYQGTRRELTIHQGLGSRTLLPEPANEAKKPTTPENRASVPPSGRPEKEPEEKGK